MECGYCGQPIEDDGSGIPPAMTADGECVCSECVADGVDESGGWDPDEGF